MTQDMKTGRYTRFIVALLLLLMCGASEVWADGITIFVEKPDGTTQTFTESGGPVALTGGSVSVTILDRNVTLTVAPASGFQTKKGLILAEKMINPDNLAPRRAPGMGTFKLEGTDAWVTTATQYTFNIPNDYAGAYVTVKFVSTTTTTATRITSLSEIPNTTEGLAGNYELAADVDGSGVSLGAFTGTLDGKNFTIHHLNHPLFASTSGNATIRNINFESVNISTDGDAGAITASADGNTRIYNCGILPTTTTYDADGNITGFLGSSVGGSGNVGGLVGKLQGTARVINCFSYANITSGNKVGGIVGNNTVTNTAATADGLKTMVMNCMFYGDITGGSSKAPIYNGTNITNVGENKGVSNFNYFWEGASYVKNKQINVYNCALTAETRYLQRFEFFRHLLNSNRELAAWWVNGSKSDMSKWVLDKSVAPYPMLKKQGYYPSVVNHISSKISGTDNNSVVDYTASTAPETSETTKTLSVTLSGTGITTTSLSLPITDKDPDNYNFNYHKVQLPYFNDVGTGNYRNGQVVTGWKVTVSGGTNSYSTGSDASATVDANGDITLTTPYNFADRNSTAKDDYNTSGRVFSQGAYFDVPKDVSSISIEPYWGKAVFIADASLDVVYNQNMSTAYNVPNVGGGVRYTNGLSYSFIDKEGSLTLPVYTKLGDDDGALKALAPTGNVYDNALVLVGNFHNIGISSTDKDQPYTIMSADFDHDNEPDYSYILRFNSRVRVHPVRVDFLNIPGLGMAQKSTGGKGTYNFGIMQPLGWFESTNTSLFRVTQFEYDMSGRTNSPIILHGGVIEQWVTYAQGGSEANKVQYYHVGGNVWFKEFHIGQHQDRTEANAYSPHPPISVTGGDYNEFYLTGLYNTPTNNYDDNAECYINGGRFNKVAGTGMQGLGKSGGADNTGNIIWQIDNADINEFYAGGINAAHKAEGNIWTVIKNSRVDLFCGGPKFGDMNSDKKVVTNANNCTFRAFFGAGYGGNSYNRRYPTNQSNKININWNSWVLEQYTNKYDAAYNGVETRIDYQFIPMSDNASNVARLFVDYVSFSLATTHDVTSKLTNCTITKNKLGSLDLFDGCIGNFYGGGSLGKVDGPVKSTLINCTVEGNAFGAGYSATLPNVSVMANSFQTEPYYDENLGAYMEAKLPTTTSYKWAHKDNISSTSDAIDKYNRILYTTENLDELGTVTGKATLNISGTTTVAGSVYGGGEESNIEGDTEVSICANYNKTSQKWESTSGTATISHNVFGGGKGIADNFTCDKAMVGVLDDGVTKVGEDPNATYTLKEGGTKVIIGNGTVNGNVYGGGEVGRVERNTQVMIGAESGTSTPEVKGSVFGAGAGVDTHGYSALVRGDATVTIQSGAKVLKNVYGGGEKASVGRYYVASSQEDVNTYNVPIGMPCYLKAGGKCTVNILGSAAIGTDNDDNTGHVFGAGQGLNPHAVTYTYQSNDTKPKRMKNDNTWEYFANETAYLTFVETLARASETDVNISGGTVKGSVFGGSESGFVYHSTDVDIQNGTINGDVFGGGKGLATYAEAGRVRQNTKVTMSNGAVNGNIYGGGQRGVTLGSVEVNMTGGTVTNDVYGGGALASTNTEANTITKDANNQDVYPTTVNLTGGTVGNAYGGGLGQKNGVNGATSDIEAIVYGDVLVNVNGTAFNITTEKDDQNNDVVKTGRVFGCNNLNGTPKKTVTVHIHKTVPVGGGGHQTGVYEIAAVYGGGNEAAYEPTISGTESDASHAHTNVIIDGCSLTSIKQVYGGGNAASTPATQVNINGSFEIDEVFGGGNGNDKIKRTSGTTTTWETNPGANVGFHAYDAESTNFNTKEKRLTQQYGYGKALVNINGGVIHAVYGGSNKKGNVREVAIAMLDQVNDDCFTVDEAYGGGKAAPMDGRAELKLGCIPGVGEIYGGARDADVNNDVVLTITNGTFDRVFGGNNEGHEIHGTITVNIEETGCSPIVIGQLFGGGNRAAYTAPFKANSTTEREDGPTLNIKSFTSIGEIYGGGFGSTAIVTGDTYININEIVGAKASAYTAKTITINEGQTDAYTVSIPAHTAGQIGSIGNVYGGGYGANVSGNTYVNIGTQSTVAYVSGTDHSNQNVVGANITGDVFGGGFGASTNVTGTATINIGEKKAGATEGTFEYVAHGAIFGNTSSIYGGSALGSVANTQVNLYAGTIPCEIFGGGKGRLAPGNVSAQSATISTKATVTLYNASVTGAIYGGCNINGTATATEVNMLGGTLGVSSTPKADILFAGGKGQNTTTTDATMNIGKVTTGTNQTTTYSGTATIYSNVYGGSALGAVGVSSTNIVNGSATVNLYQATSVTGDVFGDGMGYVDAKDNTKNVQAKMGNSTVNLYNLDLSNSNIYGGCNYNGTVYGKATVNLIGGSVVVVYGGGQGQLTAVANTGSVEVNVGTDTSTGATTITGDIYGGSAFGHVKSPVVNIYSATSIGTANAGGNVFGGGKGQLADNTTSPVTPAITASVTGTTTVNMLGATVPKAIFGGCNLNGTSVDTEINVTGGTVGSTTKADNVLYGVFGGGYGQNTSVTGDVTVNIGKTTTTGTGQNATTTTSGDATVNGDVYGGSAQGSVNNDEDATTKTTSTTVHLYAGTVNGDVYGGGLGVKTGTTNIPAQVYGDVLVDLNNYSGTCAVTGGIFGCNNANGSPEGHVTVHVYKTNKATGSNASYDLAAVYGGGNQADYEPNDSKKSTEVVIEGCNLTSIQNVYGGGNAAATPATEVWILGTKEIENVFGGGNGTVSAANVGFKTGGAAYSNGTGKAETKLVAGNVTNVFGGSNSKGDVRGGTWVTMPQKTEYSGYSATTTSCCENLVAAHIYGGGQNAPLTGGTNIVLGCQPDSWIEEIYAGSMEADVDGDVSLTITSGKFERVFGGNKNGGLLKGAIKVNIEETGGCATPIIIGELYGGGNQADYSVYGYYQDAQDGNKWKGRTKAQYDTWFASLTDAEKANPENQIKDDPQLNVRAFTSIGAIYGGGYSAKLYGNPHVDINVVKGSHYDDATIGNGTTNKLHLPYPGHTKDAIGAIGNVFGGGNLATVYGNATVNIGTESTVTFITEPAHLGTKGTGEQTLETTGVAYIQRADGLYEAKTEGAYITNNVYGGGNQANVTGDTQVNICAKKSGTTYTSVTPGSAGVTIAGDVFGAGKGVDTDPTAALVESNSFIVMGNGSVKKSVYGGGELSQVAGNTNITVMNGTIGKPKEGTTVYGGATYGNVYGGGFGATTNKLFGLIKGNTNVTISGGTILHNVYGGGAYGSVGEFTYDATTGMPTSRKANTTGGIANITITGGTIGTTGKENGMVFGSSRGDVDRPSATDNIDPNDRLAWVYDTNVTIGTENATTGPQIYGSLYGSGENGHTWHDTEVILHSGTIGVTAASDATNITEGSTTYVGAQYPNRGNIYGGGCGTDKYYSTGEEKHDGNGDTYNPLAGIVKGNATINITGGTVAHNVYGAGAMGSVGTITKENNDVVTITSGGTTTIEISGGTIGVDGTAGEGNVYGAARGDKAVTDKDLALVKETSVTISGTTTTQIKGNVYGGGEVGNVHSNTRVNIQGGAIAKNVFGGGKGVEDLFSCEQAMVGVDGEGADATLTSDANKDKGTIVTISNGTVGTLNSGNLVEGTGNVYGGGEIGRVEWNTQVKIGVGTGNGSFAPTIYGNVFGAGKGLETHGYSALVRGNSTVTVQGSAKVLKNVYGGGEKSTVGRYWVKGINNIDSNGDPVAGAPTAPNDLPVGMPYQQQSGGICSVTVQGSAQIGPDAGASADAGHIFGAGKGVNPQFNASTSKKMNNNNQLVAFTATTEKTAEELYLEFLETLALVTNSNVTIDGTATIKGSVYGGSESGFVQHDTKVEIKNGTVNGDAFGGGLGLVSFAEAGKVKGNTDLAVSGGAVKGNVYGGGSLGDVGIIDKTDKKDGQLTYNYKWKQSDGKTANVAENNKITGTNNNTGICKVTVSGGTIGANGTSTANHASGHVFGAGKGSETTWWCEKATAYATNVIIKNSGTTVYGNVYGGGQVGRVEDDAKVTIGTQDGEDAPDIKGDVFGAGAGLYTHGYSALVRGNALVTVQGAALVEGSVYGGGEIASVGKFTVVNGLPKHPDSGGICTVNIQDKAKIGASGTGHNVFGACKGVNPDEITDTNRKSMQLYTNRPSDNNLWSRYNNDENSPFIWRTYESDAAYLDFLETLALTSHPIVTIAEEATINGSVFGGGERGITLGSVEVNMNGGTVAQDVYGGGSLANSNKGNWDTATDTWAEGKTSATYTTTVNLQGGTIGGDAYGGGLGQLGDDPIEAKVYGDVAVNLGKAKDDGTADLTAAATAFNVTYYTDEGHTDVVKSGRIFGCNNLNGSPKGNVTVTVNKTVKGNIQRTAEDPNNTGYAVTDNSVPHTYELADVYGGGNLADYTPIDGKVKVIINSCDVSVMEVYGGGNAAAVPATDVEVRGAYEIAMVFGGGNGKDDYYLNGGWQTNQGANVGGNATTLLTGGYIHEAYGGSNSKGTISGNINISKGSGGCCTLNVVELYGAGKDADVEGDLIMVMGCSETRTEAVYGCAKNANVKGNMELTITSGEYGKVFGGNNESGAIFGHIVINVEETGCTPIIIDELYGCGNDAAYSTYGYYQDGNIPGTDKPKYVARTSLTDGTAVTFDGKPNTVPPYADPEINIYSCTRIGKVFGGGYGAGATVYGNPKVNINMMPGQYAVDDQLGEIGNVFGGGNEASVEGNATVNIGNKIGDKVDIAILDNDGNPVKDNGNYTYEKKTVTGARIVGNVFGGGNLAKINGSTLVNIGTAGKDNELVSINCLANTTEKPDNETNTGMVFGGGNEADVTGNTVVNMVSGYVENRIYGGGNLGSIGTVTEKETPSYHTHTTGTCIQKPKTWKEDTGKCTVTVSGGKLGKDNMKMPDDFGYVFGASRGETKDPATNPDIDFKTYVKETEVTISGTAFILGSVYGGSENGHVRGDTKVTIAGGQIGAGVDLTTAYADDKFIDPSAGVTETTALAECSHEDGKTGSTFYGNVFGGGSGYFPYAEGKWLKSAGLVEGDATVEITGGHILSNVYGGCELTDVKGKTTVKMSGGTIGVPRTKEQVAAHPMSCSLFGGGKGDSRAIFNEFTNVSSTKVEVTGGTVYGSVFGGAEDGHVTGSTDVLVSGGTIGIIGIGGESTGNVYAGGKGNLNNVKAGLIMGNTKLNVTNGTIYHNIYGGGAYGSVGTYEYNADGTIKKYVSGGLADVIVNGGTIGVNGQENGMVFGSSRGDVAKPVGTPAVDPNDKLAWVNNTHVVIGSAEGKPNIKGTVYGSGENGHVFTNTLIDIHNGTIGIAEGEPIGSYTAGGASYPYRGNVYGGGCGTDMFDSDNDGKDDAYNPLAGIVLGNATINIAGGHVVRNVYGAGAMGSVGTVNANGTISGGQTSINISDGTIGVSGTVGDGNVFGAARGDANATSNEFALVRKATSVSVTGGTVKGNVYGGGELGCVGTYVFTNDMKDFMWTNDATPDPSSYTYNNTGACNVTISGGTIGTGVDQSSDGTYANGNVFGAGKGFEDTWWCEKAIAYKTNVTITDGTINGTVYGGGQVGRVENNSVVTIGTANETGTGSKPNITGNVFGAGAGLKTHGYSALVRGDATVTVQGIAQVGGSVYGGGEVASVGRFTVVGGLPKHPDSGGTCRVTIQDNAKIGADGTGHNVFGACKGVTPAYNNTPDDPNRSKSMQLATNAPKDASLWSYYEPDHTYIWRYYATEADYLDFLETLALTSHPIVTIAEDATVNGSVFGGGERGVTLGSVEVNMNGGTVTEDVYGGGSLANTNKGNWDNGTWADGKVVSGKTEYTTAVNLHGGTINGSVFGGGLGDANTAALVYGDVTVKLNETTATDNCIVKGNVFGCNNVNGTPKGHAKVHVFKTVNSTPANNTKDSETPVANRTTYDVDAVFGGGKSADYVPEDATQSTEVIIEGCDMTSIKEVYGGGYGASTPGTNVLIKGTYIIDNVFGGGYGAGIGNPGANVGYRTEGKKAYGLGDDKYKTAVVQLMAGKVKNVYGGSNTKGDIRGGSSVTTVDKTNDAGCCPELSVQEIYGGGKEAPMEGGAEIVLGCMPDDWIGEIYAGAREANVGNDVSLTITSGKFGRVFGGNRSSGKIDGYVEVNIEECPTCNIPVVIGELYGGGNEAAYTLPDSYGKDYPSPRVNVRSFTSIGTIYGGGFGASAAVNGNPTVNINVGMVSGGGKDFEGIEEKTLDETTKVKLYPHEKNKMGVIGNVFGGGNAAPVNGNTYVNVGTKQYELLTNIAVGTTDVSDYYTRSGEGTAASPYVYTKASSAAGTADANNKAVADILYYLPVLGADIRGNVYGGGNNAAVSGKTNVVIGKKSE